MAQASHNRLGLRDTPGNQGRRLRAEGFPVPHKTCPSALPHQCTQGEVREPWRAWGDLWWRASVQPGPVVLRPGGNAAAWCQPVRLLSCPPDSPSFPTTAEGAWPAGARSWAAVGRSSGYSSVILLRSPRGVPRGAGGQQLLCRPGQEKMSHSGPAGKSQKMCSPNDSCLNCLSLRRSSRAMYAQVPTGCCTPPRTGHWSALATP